MERLWAVSGVLIISFSAIFVRLAGVTPTTSAFFTWPAHGWLLVLAVGSQVVGWQLIAAALPRLPALETSVFLLMQPMLTAVWAWLLFSELLSGAQISGMALVLAGVAWLSVSGIATRKPAGS